MTRVALFAVAGALAAASPAASVTAHSLAAQSLPNRIAGVRDGVVEFAFATRAGVCGDGNGSTWTRGHGDYVSGNGRYVCITGPVRVSIGKTDGQVVSVRACVACRPRATPSDVTSLGDVAAGDAARYLVGIARSLGGSSASEAIAAASFADGVDISPELLRLVHDDGATMQARKDALFWLGQSDVSSRELVALYGSLEPFALREQFTFVLSQRRDDDLALDKLIEIARRDTDVHVRKQAMFWLGQSKDPKAIKFFQSVLAR